MPLLNSVLSAAKRAFRFPGRESNQGGRLVRGWEAFGDNFTINLGSTRLPGAASNLNFEDLAGDGRANSAVAACLRWITSAWLEAEFQVREVQEDGSFKTLPLHPLTQLLASPNEFYDGATLAMAMLIDWYLDGNVYLQRQNDSTGKPIALSWIPCCLIEPRWEGNDWITYYEYQPFLDGSTKIPLIPAEIVHLRFGMDKDNVRKGVSWFKSLWTEIVADNQTSQYVATMMYNMGVPPIVVMPDPSLFKDSLVHGISEKEASALEKRFNEKFTGAGRGKPWIHNLPVKITQLAMDVSALAGKELRRVPEERIASAGFGIPPGVAKLGAGLDRNTYTNVEKEDDQAWFNSLIPTQRIWAKQLHFQLMPGFEAEPAKFQALYDVNSVRALQENKDKLYDRETKAWLAEAQTLDEYRESLGKTPTKGEEGEMRYSELKAKLSPLPDLFNRRADALPPDRRQEGDLIPPPTSRDA